MFFFRKLEHELLLEPRHFGPNLNSIIQCAPRLPAPAPRRARADLALIATRRRRCIDELEGTCLGKTGYIISITEVRSEDVKPGVIEYDTGYVNFKVSYNAILFRPFKHEVLDARVSTVNEVRTSPRAVSFPDLSCRRILVTAWILGRSRPCVRLRLQTRGFHISSVCSPPPSLTLSHVVSVPEHARRHRARLRR